MRALREDWPPAAANALALWLRVPANCLAEILNGMRDLSPDTASRPQPCLGPRAEFWLKLRSRYDRARASCMGPAFLIEL